MGETREYRVNVYTHERVGHDGKPLAKPRPPLVLAYTMYQGEGACIHRVVAISGDDAKRLAVRSHRATCLGLARKE